MSDPRDDEIIGFAECGGTRHQLSSKLDLIDRRLLSLLQRDNTLSLSVLATEVYSSRSAVQRRLRRLRQDGVIRAEVAIVDPELVPGLQTFVLSLEVREERWELLSRFSRKVDGMPEVQQCYLTTGDSNCVIVALLPDAQAPRPAVRAGCFIEGVPDVSSVNEPISVHRRRSSPRLRRWPYGISVPVLTAGA